jgi:TatD DNase family protein
MLHDVHAHLTHARLLPDVDAIVARAEEAGVGRIVCNGLHPEDNAAVAALAERFDVVRPAFGLYPVHAVLAEMLAAGVEYPDTPGDWTPEDAVQYVVDHAGDAVAIGEIGLDGYWVPSEFWDRQEQHFRALVRLGKALDKPIVIHTRKRERRAFEILEEEGVRKADFHCFGGRVKLARRIAAAGYHLSIPANARRNEAFTRMLQTLPRTQILLETDCPYLGPDKGVRNEPAYVRGTAEFAAELWDEPLAAVEEQLEDNYRALFGAD